MEAFEIQDESEVMSYYRLREQLSNLSQEFQSWLVKPQYLVPFLQAGNFLKIILKRLMGISNVKSPIWALLQHPKPLQKLDYKVQIL